MSVEIAVRHSFAQGSQGQKMVRVLEEFAGTIDRFAPEIADEHISHFEVIASLEFDEDIDVDQEEILDFIESLRAHKGQSGFILTESEPDDGEIPRWGLLIVPRMEFIFGQTGDLVHARCDYQIVGGFGWIDHDEKPSGMSALSMFAVGVTPVVGFWSRITGCAEASPGAVVLEHHIVAKGGLDPSLPDALREELTPVIEEARSVAAQAGPFLTLDEIHFEGSPANQAEELREKALLQQITLPTQWLSPIAWESNDRFGFVDTKNDCRSWIASTDDELGDLRSLSGWRHGNPAALMAVQDGSYHIVVAALGAEAAGAYPNAVYAQRLSLEFETHEQADVVNLVLECDQVWGDHTEPGFVAHMAEHMAIFADRLARNVFLRPTGVPRSLRLVVQGPEELIEAFEPHVGSLERQIGQFAELCPGENALEEIDVDVIDPKVVEGDGMTHLAVHPLPKVVTLPVDLEERLDELGDVEGEGWWALDLDPSSKSFAKGRWLTAADVAGKPTRLPFILFKSQLTGEVVIYSTLSKKKAPGLPTSLGASMVGDLGTATLLAMMEAGGGILWEGKAPSRTRTLKSRPFMDLVAKTFPDDTFSMVPFKQAYFTLALNASPICEEVVVDARMPAAERRHVLGCLEEKPGRGKRSRIVTIPDVPWTPLNLEIALGEMLADYAIASALECRDGTEDEDGFEHFLTLVRGTAFAIANGLNGGRSSPFILSASSRLLDMGGSSSLADTVFREIASRDLKALRTVEDSVNLVQDVLKSAMEADLEL